MTDEPTEPTEPTTESRSKVDWETIPNGAMLFSVVMTKTGDDEVSCTITSDVTTKGFALANDTYRQAEAADIVQAVYQARNIVSWNRRAINLLNDLFRQVTSTDQTTDTDTDTDTQETDPS